jgi:hypothetical protein
MHLQPARFAIHATESRSTSAHALTATGEYPEFVTGPPAPGQILSGRPQPTVFQPPRRNSSRCASRTNSAVAGVTGGVDRLGAAGGEEHPVQVAGGTCVVDLALICAGLFSLEVGVGVIKAQGSVLGPHKDRLIPTD